MLRPANGACAGKQVSDRVPPPERAQPTIYGSFFVSVQLVKRAVLIAVAGGLLAAAPAHADWTPGVADLQTVAATEVEHDVAVDDAGNGLAVWDAPVSGRTVIRARRYDAAASVWETPVRELSVPTGTTRKPVVAMDRAGNAMVLWQRYVGERWTVQARRFDRAASAWESAAATLSVGEEDSIQPALAFEADGDAFAVWRADGVIRARRFDAAAGAWESASAALSSDTGGAELPAVQVDAGGVATVAWQTGGAIEAKRYDAAQGALARRRRRACRRRARPPRACGSASTRPVSSSAVWSATDASGTFVQSRRFDGGWGAPALLSPKLGTTYAPQLAVAPERCGHRRLVRAVRRQVRRPRAALDRRPLGPGHDALQPVDERLVTRGRRRQGRSRDRRLAPSGRPVDDRGPPLRRHLGHRPDRPVRHHRRRSAGDRRRPARRRAGRLAAPGERQT